MWDIVTIVFRSFEAFGKLSKGQLFMMDALRWAPSGFISWVFKADKSPGLVRVRENRVYVHEVATKLIEEKRQELKDGTPQRDVLTLLGSFCVAFTKADRWYSFQSFSKGELLPEAGLAAQ
jgi:hypothetical protein